MRPIDRLKHLLETHGIYDQAMRLMRLHVAEAKTPAEKTDTKTEKSVKHTDRLSNARGPTDSGKTGEKVKEDAPKGWKGTVKTMKSRHKDEIDNPYALTHYMKNKGYQSHKTKTGKAKD